MLGGAWVWQRQEGLSGGGALEQGWCWGVHGAQGQARSGADSTQPRPVSWVVGSQCWGAGASAGTSHLMRTHSWVSLRTWKKWVSREGGASVGRALRLQETLCSPPGVKCLVHEHECEHVHACT